MKKSKDGLIDFSFNNESYTIDWHGRWLKDGPNGYEIWLEEMLVWNCYTENGKIVENVDILIKAERLLEFEIWSILT